MLDIAFGLVAKRAIMAEILSDKELETLFGTVIKDGVSAGIRPNSYVIRIGKEGAFLNTHKKFKFSDQKKGARLPPGQSIALTSLEEIDFREETVHKFFPGCQLHGILSPTTDWSREGVVAPTTQIDAGYNGIINWTMVNTSSGEVELLSGETFYRLTIFKLQNNEIPSSLYEGDYQGKKGYIPSQRRGAPQGMRKDEWIDAFDGKGPENALKELLDSGYPWNMLGTRLKKIDDQFETVTAEYDDISDRLEKINESISEIKKDYANDNVRMIVREETPLILNDTIMKVFSALLVVGGLLVQEAAQNVLSTYLSHVGVGAVLIGCIYMFIRWRKKK